MNTHNPEPKLLNINQPGTLQTSPFTRRISLSLSTSDSKARDHLATPAKDPIPEKQTFDANFRRPTASIALSGMWLRVTAGGQGLALDLLGTTNPAQAEAARTDMAHDGGFLHICTCGCPASAAEQLTETFPCRSEANSRYVDNLIRSCCLQIWFL